MQAQLLILGLKFRTKINRSLLAGFDRRVNQGVGESYCEKSGHGFSFGFASPVLALAEQRTQKAPSILTDICRCAR